MCRDEDITKLEKGVVLGIELLYARLHMIWDHDHAMKCEKLQVSEKLWKFIKVFIL